MCLWWTTERVAFVSSSITRSTQHTRIGFFPFNSHISHLFLCSRTIRWLCRFSIGIREKTHHSQRTEQKEKCYGWKAATTAANILFHFSVACLATASRPRSIPPFVLVHKQNCTPFTPNARAKTERSRQCSILFSSPFLLGRIRPLSPRTPHHTKPLSLHTRFYPSRAPERIEFLRNRKKTTQQQKKIGRRQPHAIACIVRRDIYPVSCSRNVFMMANDAAALLFIPMKCIRLLPLSGDERPTFLFLCFLDWRARSNFSTNISNRMCVCVCVWVVRANCCCCISHRHVASRAHSRPHNAPFQHSSVTLCLQYISSHRLISKQNILPPTLSKYAMLLSINEPPPN